MLKPAALERSIVLSVLALQLSLPACSRTPRERTWYEVGSDTVTLKQELTDLEFEAYRLAIAERRRLSDTTYRYMTIQSIVAEGMVMTGRDRPPLPAGADSALRSE